MTDLNVANEVENHCAKCGTPDASNEPCTDCYLVVYCNDVCLGAHQDEHNKACRSKVRGAEWMPHWGRIGQKREPDWTLNMNYGFQKKYKKAGKYLWGNTPAIDTLNLKDNEGPDYSGDLNLLLAASGDLRHLIKTIALLPEGYSGKITVVINDFDVDVVKRNAMLLGIALKSTSQNEDQAIDCFLHVWYSAFLRDDHIHYLTTQLLPEITTVCSSIVDDPMGTFHPCWIESMNLSLTETQWRILLQLCNNESNRNFDNAYEHRLQGFVDNYGASAVQDGQDYQFIKHLPQHRMPRKRFSKDGILLPFGYDRSTFRNPNATLFVDGVWSLEFHADPMYGWNFAEIVRQDSGSASNDLYGKLYCYLKALIRNFCHRLRDLNCEIRMLNYDALKLPDEVKRLSYDRIECSNIADHIYAGMRNVLQDLSPLLRPHQDNKHATLLTLFMLASREARKTMDSLDPQMLKQIKKNESKRADILLKMSEWEARNIPHLQRAALPLAQDNSYFFKMYKRCLDFEQMGQSFQMEIKNGPTIIEEEHGGSRRTRMRMARGKSSKARLPVTIVDI